MQGEGGGDGFDLKKKKVVLKEHFNLYFTFKLLYIEILFKSVGEDFSQIENPMTIIVFHALTN